MQIAAWILAGALTSSLDAPSPDAATFVVKLVEASPPRFVVEADWPAGGALQMDTTRPGDLPEILKGGWPALVKNLRVVDASGAAVHFTSVGAAGWKLPEGLSGRIRGSYEVETALLAQHGWPAPREAYFVDEGLVSVVGRSLFIVMDTSQSALVTFELPDGWKPVAPWNRHERAGSRESFSVPAIERLRANLLVLTRSAPVIEDAGGFRIAVVPLGEWRDVRREIQAIVRKHVRRFVNMMAFDGKEAYVAVLLPFRDNGAESYRQSMALTFGEVPTAANASAWGNLIGHELFHYWNGWLLAGADYPTSQWFQEGFTEYAANVSTVAAKLTDAAGFRAKLAGHVANYRRLTTSLEGSGTHKGPPLYSAGALVAFTWDVAIRDATVGKRGLDDFWRALSRRCASGTRRYGPDDVVAAMNETTGTDWASWMETYVRGTTPLPLDATFRRAGLRLVEPGDGTVNVVADAAAGPKEKRTFENIARGR